MEELDEVHVDCLTAIMLHNSLFKFSIAMYKDSEHRKPAMKSEYHPLAYLLMLCDELQCWDRHSYGRNTRVELHPMNATFDFSSNGIQITYLFDEDNCGIIDEYLSRCDAAKRWGKPEIPKLPSYSEMIGDKPKFAEEIKKVVDLSAIPFSVKVRTAPRDAGAKHTYLSESSFLHLFDFAVLTHKRKHEGKTQEQLEDALECLSLEYQLSHLNRAKGFAKYLNEIHCFYTDRAVSFELVKEFSDQQVNKISSLEHVRWVREHQQMGWQSGTDYQAIAKKFKPTIEGAEGTLREQMRQHKLVLNEAVSDEMILSQYFNDLTEDEKAKDISAMNQMLIVLRQYDGLRIYRMEF